MAKGSTRVANPFRPILIRLTLSVASLWQPMPGRFVKPGNAAVYVLGRLRLMAPATEANLYASYCMNQP
jgi:hypothetical protein